MTLPDTIASLPVVRLHDESSDSSATIALHGAHVLSWTHAGRDRLFMSPGARAPSIRGGVPVIFPQFGLFGEGPKHGIARDRDWHCVEHDATSALFALQDSHATRVHFPHAFALQLRVRLEVDALSLHLQVENTGASDFAFAAGLHTYLAVDDIATTVVHGLAGTDCLDAARSRRDHHASDTLHFHGEVDRVFFDFNRPLRVEDGVSTVLVEASGFPDTVIWNPGAELAARLDDLGADAARRFVCVEAAQVLPRPLAAGASWSGLQRLAVR